MYTASDLADWWEKNRQDSEKELTEFVQENPNMWIPAAVLMSAIDVGATFVDLLRFGEGMAESYETGAVLPLVQDVFRGVGVALPVAKGLNVGRALIGRAIGLYADTAGNTCALIATGNAMRRTGQRLFVNLDEIAKAHGGQLSVIESLGTNNQQTFTALSKLGVRFRDLGNARSFDNLARIAQEGDGVVMMRLEQVGGGIGHIALLEKTPKGIQIVDRSGFYNTLGELSRAYKTIFAVDPDFQAKVILDVSARLVSGRVTLMAAASMVVGLPKEMTIQQLDVRFREFKALKQSKPEAVARVTVAKGDTLSGLAKTHYGAFDYWPLIWDANREVVGENPNRIKSGQVLKIPPFSSFSETQLADARKRHPTWKNYPS